MGNLLHMSKKPASRRIAKALPRGRLFGAQFAMPGMVPEMVRDATGKEARFGSADEAVLAADRACLRVYDSRITSTTKQHQRRLSASEFSALLVDLNITATYFAEIIGVPMTKVLAWLDGQTPLPHYVHVIARLMAASPANFELAEHVTEACRTEGESDDEEDRPEAAA